jgi:CrcB protein
LVLLDKFQDVLLVSFGAIFGANSRFLIYKGLEKIKFRKDLIILVINTISSFCLGFFISVLPSTNYLKYSYQLGLFFLIGYLGSLSSFSTFIYELFNIFQHFKFNRAIYLLFISITLGILSMALGFLIGQ